MPEDSSYGIVASHMWALTRIAEFNRALHSADDEWNAAEGVADLQFPQGLLFSVLLVTPFWTAVGFAFHLLTK